ncbi:hypothetical protein P154DRAFT_260219 [Amniculicola lignicola CBS 123094]|uniref:Uncharacterized protein n=1 Tax=Amniculicola lignicola CBS 123094 TaxID=1392246 RepID=A0A6A5WGE5_9PLEO|nr:hypothetical protein P154DRAFT_260219 [Amniculicola lignicola CBS 123094]
MSPCNDGSFCCGNSTACCEEEGGEGGITLAARFTWNRPSSTWSALSSKNSANPQASSAGSPNTYESTTAPPLNSALISSTLAAPSPATPTPTPAENTIEKKLRLALVLSLGLAIPVSLSLCALLWVLRRLRTADKGANSSHPSDDILLSALPEFVSPAHEL